MNAQAVVESLRVVNFDEKPFAYRREISSGDLTHFVVRNPNGSLGVISAASLAGKPMSRIFADLSPEAGCEQISDAELANYKRRDRSVLVEDASGNIVGILPGHSPDHQFRKLVEDRIHEHYARIFNVFRHETLNICNGLSGILELDNMALENPHMREIQRQIIGLTKDKLVEFMEVYLGSQKNPASRGNEISLSKIIQDAILLSTGEALKKNIEILPYRDNQSAAGIKLPSVFGLQILLNLLQNAIRYTASGKSIGVFAAEITHNDAPHLLLSVSDAGRGIPGADLASLFDEGFRGQDTAEIQGQGLGLALVKSLASKLGADIKVFSPPRYFPVEEGRGTEFCVFFPLNRQYGLREQVG